MRKERALKECSGLAFERFFMSRNNDQMALLFADGSFSVLEAQKHYEYDSEIAEVEFNIPSFGVKEAVAAGIISHQEARDYEAKLEADGKARQESHERFRYEQLKKKFEQS